MGRPVTLEARPDLGSFNAWHHHPLCHQSQKGIPQGLKLVLAAQNDSPLRACLLLRSRTPAASPPENFNHIFNQGFATKNRITTDSGCTIPQTRPKRSALSWPAVAAASATAPPLLSSSRCNARTAPFLRRNPRRFYPLASIWE